MMRLSEGGIILITGRSQKHIEKLNSDIVVLYPLPKGKVLFNCPSTSLSSGPSWQ